MTINELFDNKDQLSSTEKIKAFDLIMGKKVYIHSFWIFKDSEDYNFSHQGEYSLTPKEFELLKKVYKFYKEKENETT